jgi:hypothetical protein
VFVDVNMDGNYTQADDLVFDLRDVQDAGVSIFPAGIVATDLYNDANANGADPTDNGIFIFTDGQYAGFWN